MHFFRLRCRRKLVDNHGNRGWTSHACGSCRLGLRLEAPVAIPFVMIATLFGNNASLVLEGLFFQMVKRFSDGSPHVASLRQSDQRTDTRVDCDFCLVTVLLDGENHLGVELIA